MGVNLFVEGRPVPVVVRVRLERSVSDVQCLMEVVQSLRSVESFLHREWPRLWDGYEYRRKREVHLLSFRVESPPDFKILTDPAWLAVFLTILAGYKSMKENAREIRNDT